MYRLVEGCTQIIEELLINSLITASIEHMLYTILWRHMDECVWLFVLKELIDSWERWTVGLNINQGNKMPYGRSSTDCTKEVIFGTQNQVDRSSPGRDRRKCIPWSRKKVWDGGASLCERLTEGKRGSGRCWIGLSLQDTVHLFGWSLEYLEWGHGFWKGNRGTILEVRNLKFIIKVIM